jgi:hypothetical protein
MSKHKYRTDAEYRKNHLASKNKKYWGDEEHRERHRKACRERYRKKVGMLMLADVRLVGRHASPATGRPVTVYRGTRDGAEVLFYMRSGSRVFIEGEHYRMIQERREKDGAHR